MVAKQDNLCKSASVLVNKQEDSCMPEVCSEELRRLSVWFLDKSVSASASCPVVYCRSWIERASAALQPKQLCKSFLATMREALSWMRSTARTTSQQMRVMRHCKVQKLWEDNAISTYLLPIQGSVYTVLEGLGYKSPLVHTQALQTLSQLR